MSWSIRDKATELWKERVEGSFRRGTGGKKKRGTIGGISGGSSAVKGHPLDPNDDHTTTSNKNGDNFGSDDMTIQNLNLQNQMKDQERSKTHVSDPKEVNIHISNPKEVNIHISGKEGLKALIDNQEGLKALIDNQEGLKALIEKQEGSSALIEDPKIPTNTQEEDNDDVYTNLEWASQLLEIYGEQARMIQKSTTNLKKYETAMKQGRLKGPMAEEDGLKDVAEQLRTGLKQQQDSTLRLWESAKRQGKLDVVGALHALGGVLGDKATSGEVTLIGGLALRLKGYSRNTRDIDIDVANIPTFEFLKDKLEGSGEFSIRVLAAKDQESAGQENVMHGLDIMHIPTQVTGNVRLAAGPTLSQNTTSRFRIITGFAVVIDSVQLGQKVRSFCERKNPAKRVIGLEDIEKLSAKLCAGLSSDDSSVEKFDETLVGDCRRESFISLLCEEALLTEARMSGILEHLKTLSIITSKDISTVLAAHKDAKRDTNTEKEQFDLSALQAHHGGNRSGAEADRAGGGEEDNRETEGKASRGELEF